jgi:iron(III) transport system permease protein
MAFAAPFVRRPGKPPGWLLVAAAIPVVLLLLPLFYVAMRSSEAGWAGIGEELLRPRIVDLIVGTLTLGVGVTVATALIGTTAAWLVERCDLPARRALRVALCLPLAIPAFVVSYSWSSMSGRFESMWGAILVLSLSSYPLVYLPVSAAIRGMNPNLEHVARSLGSSRWRIFRTVVLPQALPAIGGGALLVYTHMLAEFGALSLLRVQTFTTAIYQSYELQFDNASAAMQSAVLMLLCFPAVYGEVRLRGKARLDAGGRAKRYGVPIALGRLRPLALFGIAMLLLLALGVPIFMLVYWLAHGTSAGHGLDEVWAALAGSLSLAVPGAFLTAALALPVVVLSVRFRGVFGRIAERLPYVVHGLPGLVVALALIFVSIHYVPTLYQTAPLLLAAYAVLFLPLAQSAIKASLELVPVELEQVSRTLGRGPFATFLSVTLPNIAPGLGAATALMALELMRELTATLLLAPTGVTTLATAVWSYTNDTQYAAAAPFAALLVALSVPPVYLFTRRTFQIYDL